MRPALTELQALDFPHGVHSYVEGDTDTAGRFQGSSQQGHGPGAPTARTGMSIDERLPEKEEVERRRVIDVASRIEAFLHTNPGATWDFAAPAAIHDELLAALSDAARARLGKVLAKDLVHQPVSELLAHFAEK